MAGNNILVVDDDNKTVSKIVDVLESEGYAVFAASSKSSAVELCTKTKPSLIYVNAILTDASGLEITRAIRGIDFMKTVPIVMLTEMEEEFSERYKSTYGIIGFLKKPIDTKDLVQKTSSLVSKDSAGGEDAFSALGIEKTAPPAMPEPEETAEVAEAMEFGEISLAPEQEPAPSFAQPEPEEDLGTMAFKSFEESEEVEAVERSFSGEKPEESKQPDEKPSFRMNEKKSPSFTPPVDNEMDDLDAESMFDQNDSLPGISDDSDFGGYEGFTAVESKSKKSLIVNIIIALVAVSSLAAVAYMWFFMDFSEKSAKRPAQRAAVPSQVEPVTPQTQVSPQPAVQPEASKPVAPPSEEKPVVSLPAVQKPEQSAQAQKSVEAGTSLSAKKQEPASAPSSKKGRYSVQVGYFSVKDNAYGLHDALKQKKYDVFIEKVRTRTGTRYRVLIGSYHTQAEALKDMNRIKAREGIDASIYRRKS